MKRKVIRKGHPEDDTFVERSHLTDDEEFYLPFLKSIKTEQGLNLRSLSSLIRNAACLTCFVCWEAQVGHRAGRVEVPLFFVPPMFSGATSTILFAAGS